MAKAQLHTSCCEIDARIAEEELEWLSFEDEMLYMHILYFTIKSLIFYYSLTHLRLSLTLSDSLMHTDAHTRALAHTHTHPAAVFLPCILHHTVATNV